MPTPNADQMKQVEPTPPRGSYEVPEDAGDIRDKGADLVEKGQRLREGLQHLTVGIHEDDITESPIVPHAQQGRELSVLNALSAVAAELSAMTGVEVTSEEIAKLYNINPAQVSEAARVVRYFHKSREIAFFDGQREEALARYAADEQPTQIAGKPNKVSDPTN